MRMVYKHFVYKTSLYNLLAHVSIVDDGTDLSRHSAGKQVPNSVLIDSGSLECLVGFPAGVGRRIHILFRHSGYHQRGSSGITDTVKHVTIWNCIRRDVLCFLIYLTTLSEQHWFRDIGTENTFKEAVVSCFKLLCHHFVCRPVRRTEENRWTYGRIFRRWSHNVVWCLSNTIQKC
jgi:hypothetical protein